MTCLDVVEAMKSPCLIINLYIILRTEVSLQEIRFQNSYLPGNQELKCFIYNSKIVFPNLVVFLTLIDESNKLDNSQSYNFYVLQCTVIIFHLCNSEVF